MYVSIYYIHKYYIHKYYIQVSKNYKSTYGLIWEQVLYIFAKLLIVWGGRDPIDTKDPGIWMCRDLNVPEVPGLQVSRDLSVYTANVHIQTIVTL